MTGSADRVVSPGESVRLAGLIRVARFELFPDAGHMLPMERSAEVAELILRFADEVDSQAQPNQPSGRCTTRGKPRS